MPRKPNARVVRIPLFRQTRDTLLIMKLNEQARLGRRVTWDEFLLSKKGC